MTALSESFLQAQQAQAFKPLVRDHPGYSVGFDRFDPSARFEFQPLLKDWPCFFYVPGQGQRDGLIEIRRAEPRIGLHSFGVA